MLQTLGHLKLSWVHTHPVAVKVIDEGTLCEGCMASVMPRKLSVCLVTRETICCSSDHNSYELLSVLCYCYGSVVPPQRIFSGQSCLCTVT